MSSDRAVSMGVWFVALLLTVGLGGCGGSEPLLPGTDGGEVVGGDRIVGEGTRDQESRPSGPALTGISPLSGLLTGGYEATISARGLPVGEKVLVLFGGRSARVERAGGTAVVVVVPSSPAAGVVEVQVIYAGHWLVLQGGFRYAAVPVEAPVVSGLKPVSGPLWGAEVTISGRGLTALGKKTEVLFGGAAGRLVSSAAGKLVVAAPIREDPGAVDVIVRHAGGETTVAKGFEYRRRVPQGAGHGVYLTLEEIELFQEEMSRVYPHLVRQHRIGSTYEGRDIWALKLSDEPDRDDPTEPEILITSGLHSREQLPVYYSVSLVQDLLRGYSRSARIKALLDGRQVWFVLLANPDGKAWDLPADGSKPRNWRKSRRPNGNGSYGVDLNRNWSIRWGGASTDPSSNVYQGAFPFSEPETRALRAFVDRRPLRLLLDIHAYANALWLPPYLTRVDRDLFLGLRDGFLKAQKNPHPATTLYPAGSYPTKARTGNTGLFWQWGYYVRGVTSAILETRGEGSNQFYPSGPFMEREYEENGRDALLFLIEHASKQPLVKQPRRDSGPWLVFEKLTIDDNTVGDSKGDGDRVPEPGETIEIRHYLRNDGKVTARAVWATLTSEDRYVRVLTEYKSSYGDIAPGSSASINPKGDSTDFAVAISSGTPRGYKIRFVLHAFDAERRRWDLPFTLQVK